MDFYNTTIEKSNTNFDDFGKIFSSLLDGCNKRTTYAIAHILKTINYYCNLYGSVYYSYSPVNSSFFKRCAIGNNISDWIRHYYINSSTLESIGLNININDFCLLETSSQVKKQLGITDLLPYQINQLFALPIPVCNRDNNLMYGDTNRYGLLLCFPNPNTIFHEVYYHRFKQTKHFIGQLICHSVNIDKIILRNDLTTMAVTSPDLQSYFHKVMQLLKDKWFFEAGSAFVIDEKRSLLRLYATTGIEEERSKQDTYYRIDENEVILECFKNAREIFIYKPNNENNDSKFREHIEYPRVATCWLPVSYFIDRLRKQSVTIGVIRVTNRIFKYGSRYIAGPLTWEDLEILRFVTDISGVIEAIIRTSKKRKIGLERTLHGVKSNVLSALTRFNHLIERSKFTDHLEPQFKHYISDSIASLNAVQFQIDNFISLYRTIRIRMEKVKLYGNVLSKVVAGISDAFRIYNLPKLEITRLADSGFDSIPFIVGDIHALIIIYWNVLDNALKYSNPDKTCRVDISYEIIGNFVDVDITSYGIEIPSEYHNWIFVEGFRCENAIRRRTIGSGIGLPQSRYLANEMGGDLFLKTSSNGKTIFTVRSKKWED